MVRVFRCHRQNMKTNIINGSEVSRLSVAIQFDLFSKASIITIKLSAYLGHK